MCVFAHIEIILYLCGTKEEEILPSIINLNQLYGLVLPHPREPTRALAHRSWFAYLVRFRGRFQFSFNFSIITFKKKLVATGKILQVKQ